jgi:hypothetical protein
MVPTKQSVSPPPSSASLSAFLSASSSASQMLANGDDGGGAKFLQAVDATFLPRLSATCRIGMIYTDGSSSFAALSSEKEKAFRKSERPYLNGTRGAKADADSEIGC